MQGHSAPGVSDFLGSFLNRFQALDCVTVAGRRYVKVDTSLDCDSPESQGFRLLDSFFITAYLGIPLLWLVLLYQRRAEMNPRTLDLRLKYYLRDRNIALNPFRFLFDVYRPPFYFLDVAEMYGLINGSQVHNLQIPSLSTFSFRQVPPDPSRWGPPAYK